MRSSLHLHRRDKTIQFLDMADFDHVERLRIVHVDARGSVVGVTEQSSGRSDRIDLSMRALVADALRLDATALVLSHNHPGGDPTPSRADIEATYAILQTVGPLGIRLHDHVVTGKGRDFSFRAAGLL
jgi:DNA repair protein RadC